GFSVKEAVGTSLACVGILAIPGTITHALLGDIDWWYAIALSIGVIPGARIGSHLAIRASERSFRLTIAIVLSSIAVVYGLGELLALL
ncbi:MAG: TSUP family transporter, partial [Acidimicrobiia bacterium]